MQKLWSWENPSATSTRQPSQDCKNHAGESSTSHSTPINIFSKALHTMQPAMRDSTGDLHAEAAYLKCREQMLDGSSAADDDSSLTLAPCTRRAGLCLRQSGGVGWRAAKCLRTCWASAELPRVRILWSPGACREYGGKVGQKDECRMARKVMAVILVMAETGKWLEARVRHNAQR